MEKKNAFLSVYNKDGIAEFARALVEMGWRVISSTGTAKHLAAAGVPITDVADISGLKPILEHRVATLVPHVHGGLLATESMMEELGSLGYPWIDLVCCDLYPLATEIAREGSTRESVINQTDIGGPTMLRSGAKGRRIVICDPNDRQWVLGKLQLGILDDRDREMLAAKTEGVIANYCLTSARYISGDNIDGMIGTNVRDLRYGENPWQTPAALFSVGCNDPLSLDRFRQFGGSDPSLVNLTDVDRLLQTVTHIAAAFDTNCSFVPKIAVAVKHGNACGAAIGSLPIRVLQGMIAGDLEAIHGAVVMTNFPIGLNEAEQLRRWESGEKKRLLDGVVAPQFSGSAFDELERVAGKCRMLQNPALGHLGRNSLDQAPRFRQVRGGFLRQPNYTHVLNLLDVVIDKHGLLTELGEYDMLLAWALCATSNSNTITIVRDGMMLANGVGQQARHVAAEVATIRAKHGGHVLRGATVCSDSFFPFVDGPTILADAGVNAILTTSGSKTGDEPFKQLCDERGIVRYMIPDQYRMFFGH